MYLTKGVTVLLVLFCHERTSSPVVIIISDPPTTPATAPTSSSSRITEICIGCPDEYNGKAETAQAWLDSVHLYLLINQALYHDKNRKIAYALSYMKKGSTANKDLPTSPSGPLLPSKPILKELLGMSIPNKKP